MMAWPLHSNLPSITGNQSGRVHIKPHCHCSTWPRAQQDICTYPLFFPHPLEMLQSDLYCADPASERCPSTTCPQKECFNYCLTYFCYYLRLLVSFFLTFSDFLPSREPLDCSESFLWWCIQGCSIIRYLTVLLKSNYWNSEKFTLSFSQRPCLLTFCPLGLIFHQHSSWMQSFLEVYFEISDVEYVWMHRQSKFQNGPCS